jgi:hypothetical protein
MHTHQAFPFTAPNAMDRKQLISLSLLLLMVFGLVLAGTRAFSDGSTESEEISVPPAATPLDRPEPPSPPLNWDPAWLYERRFA